MVQASPKQIEDIGLTLQAPHCRLIGGFCEGGWGCKEIEGAPNSMPFWGMYISIYIYILYIFYFYV